MGKSAAQLEREIAEVLSRKKKTRSHAVKAVASSRWIHRDVARRLDVPEDVVRRIYAAVQTAKKQGLYGGYYADLVERNVGRKLVGNEYDVASRAKKHLNYDPPGGYGGPKPTGSAKEPARVSYNDPKVARASQLVASAESSIKGVLSRRRHRFPWNEEEDRELLRQAAGELEVAADLYEEAGAHVRAGTLHTRAKFARSGNYDRLIAYD